MQGGPVSRSPTPGKPDQADAISVIGSVGDVLSRAIYYLARAVLKRISRVLGLRPRDVVPLRETTPLRSWLRSEPGASASGSPGAPKLAVRALGAQREGSAPDLS